jgi:hypothetical protein
MAARPQALARFVIGGKKPARRQPLLMSIGAIEIEIALTQNVTITDDTLCVERWRGAWPAKNGSKINPSPFFSMLPGLGGKGQSASTGLYSLSNHC